MTERISRLYSRLKEERTYPICVEKAKIMTESFNANEGWPEIVKRAKAVEEYLKKRTIFIAEDELIVGNQAQKYMGMELKPMSCGWPDDDLDSILDSGLLTLSEEERKTLRSLDAYWLDRGKTMDERYAYYYDEERLFPYVKRGFVCPPWKSNYIMGQAGEGWGLKGTYGLICPDYSLHLYNGFRSFINEVKSKLSEIRYFSKDDLAKADFLKSAIIIFEAVIHLANRYADLAEEMAKNESNEIRAAELREIADTCRRVPEYPARTFREGIQAFTFYWFMMSTVTLGLGRFDQYMWPLYKADLDAGRITREEALELLECMRLKFMEYNYLGGGKFQREKLSGLARWNNMIIGGCDKDGNDATNELSYLILEAAMEVPTPHPTITIRVSKNTPASLIQNGLKLVRTGCGFPAFISEDEYISYLTGRGIDIREAREFAISGCLDIALPGRSRMSSIPMFVVPTVLELALNNGKNPKTGEFFGLATGEFEEFDTFEQFYDAFLQQLRLCVGMACEKGNIKAVVDAEMYPDAFSSCFFHDSLNFCRDIWSRPVKYDNSAAINVVGMVNTIDSLAAIKKLVFDDKSITSKQLINALRNNWKDSENIRKMCLNAPKYGNNLDYVDEIGERFWKDLRAIIESYNTVFGKPYITSAISVSAHAPGGRFTGATPDGRCDGDTLADGSVSPAQGMDINGPLAVLQSAMRMSKGWSVNLLNMKLTPSTLKTDQDLEKLGSMVSTFLTNGGKHIQFNVVDRNTLIEAKSEKIKHRDLLVRVAGYSTYFVILSPAIQDEIISRTEHVL